MKRSRKVKNIISFHLEIFHEHKHINFLSRSQNYIGSLCNRKYKLNEELKRAFFLVEGIHCKDQIINIMQMVNNSRIKELFQPKYSRLLSSEAKQSVSN